MENVSRNMRYNRYNVAGLKNQKHQIKISESAVTDPETIINSRIFYVCDIKYRHTVSFS